MSAAEISTHVFGTIVESSKVFAIGDKAFIQFARVKRMLRRGAPLVAIVGQRHALAANTKIHGCFEGYITPPNLYRIPVLTIVKAMERKASSRVSDRLAFCSPADTQTELSEASIIDGACQFVSSRPLTRGRRLRKAVQAVFPS